MEHAEAPEQDANPLGLGNRAMPSRNDGTSPADLGFSPDMVEADPVVLGGARQRVARSRGTTRTASDDAGHVPDWEVEEEDDDLHRPMAASAGLMEAFGWLIG